MDQGIILSCKELIKHALQVDPKRRATAIALRNGLAAICKQDRNSTKSVAGSPTTSKHAFSIQPSDPMPAVPLLPHSVTDFQVFQLEASGTAQSQSSPQLESIPSRPHGIPILGAVERRSLPNQFSRPQTDPPTPPDDHPISSKVPPLADTESLATGGDSSTPAETRFSPKNQAQHHVPVPERVSSQLVNAALGVPKISPPLMTQPTSTVNLNIAQSNDGRPRYLAPSNALETMSKGRLAPIELEQQHLISTDSRNLQLSSQNLMIPSLVAFDAPRKKSSNAVGKLPDSSSLRKEDRPSKKIHKPSRFPHLFQSKNEKSRSQSLPELPIATATPDLSEGSTSRAQRFSTPNRRPPNNSTISESSVLHSQYVAPYAETISSSSEEYVTAPSGGSSNPISTRPGENTEEQRSASSGASSRPQLEPPQMRYWAEAHNERQVARALSNRSSVPSVNGGDAKPHLFLNIPKNTNMTLVSSTAAKVAFVAPHGVDIATLYEPDCKNCIEAPQDTVWERGSLAGNFLALQGFNELSHTYVCSHISA